MKHAKLKPCADCGGNGYLRVFGRYQNEPTYSVYCLNCIMRTPEYASAEEAVEAWNGRKAEKAREDAE